MPLTSSSLKDDMFQLFDLGLRRGKAFFSSFFLWLYLCHMEVPREGVELELQLPVCTTPKQCKIWAVTYTAACSNFVSLTHWVNPQSSWIIVRFLTCWATMGTPGKTSLQRSHVLSDKVVNRTKEFTAEASWASEHDGEHIIPELKCRKSKCI